jgi:hypothetical protein
MVTIDRRLIEVTGMYLKVFFKFFMRFGMTEYWQAFYESSYAALVADDPKKKSVF